MTMIDRDQHGQRGADHLLAAALAHERAQIAKRGARARRTWETRTCAKDRARGTRVRQPLAALAAASRRRTARSLPMRRDAGRPSRARSRGRSARAAAGGTARGPSCRSTALSSLGQRAPRLGRPVEPLGDRRRVLDQQPLVVAELGRFDLAVRAPSNQSAKSASRSRLRRSSSQSCFARAGRQPIGDRRHSRGGAAAGH